MKEFIGQLPGKAIEKAKESLREHISPQIISLFSDGNLENIHEFALKHLGGLGIQPKFTQEGNPQLEDMRKRLNTEPGVIICNHPGWGDTFEILSVLKREDLKIMMEKKYFDLLPPGISNRYFFPNERNPAKAMAVFRKIQDHIKNGGVLLIYPSGGKEQSASHHDSTFMNGFRVLLRGLKPEQMVYCFNINETDTANINPHKPRIFLASEVLLHSHLDATKDPQVVRLDEVYTQAGEWQEAIKDERKDAANKRLTTKYEAMFASNK
jgi:hypothetical protein